MNWYKFLILGLLFNGVALAQVDTAWVRRYNGPADSSDVAKALRLDNEGNVCVFGSSVGKVTGADYLIIKYDNDGNELWSARYDSLEHWDDGPFFSAWGTMAVDNSCNIYVTGVSKNPSTGDEKWVTVKYDKDGNELWVRTYHGTANIGWNQALDLAIDDRGHVYVTGSSDDKNAEGGVNFCTIKYNANGDEVWRVKYNGPANSADIAYRVTVDPSSPSNIYVTGASKGFGGGYGYDYTTIKYDCWGNELWVARYNGPNNKDDYSYLIKADSYGNVYISGRSYYVNGFVGDITTIKYDRNGNELWVQKYSGPENDDEACDLVIDAIGNVYVTGVSMTSTTRLDYITLKYSPDGDLLWSKRYDAGNTHLPKWDIANAICVDDEGGVYVTGYSSGEDWNDYFATVKYDKDGNELWVARYTGFAHETWACGAWGIAVDNESNVYITGGSPSSITGFAYATIKYVQSQGILESQKEMQEESVSFLGRTISFSLEKASYIKAILYDLSGRMLAYLFDGMMGKGQHNLSLPTGVSNGVYFIRIEGEIDRTFKVVRLL
ncbi:MAG: hypothetical protein QMD71_01125 [bacterium]|nr:hypothetical protein [bacterium]